MSALPSKYIPVEYSAVGVASILLAALQHNDTVSVLWDRVKHDSRVRTFDRFANALTILFAGHVIMLEKGVLRVDISSKSPK